MDLVAFLRAAAAIVLLLWLPGWLWARVVLPSVDGFGRFAAAVILSIALVSFTLYVLNAAARVPLTGTLAILAALGWSAGAIATWHWRRRIPRLSDGGANVDATQGDGVARSEVNIAPVTKLPPK